MAIKLNDFSSKIEATCDIQKIQGVWNDVFSFYDKVLKNCKEDDILTQFILKIHGPMHIFNVLEIFHNIYIELKTDMNSKSLSVDVKKNLPMIITAIPLHDLGYLTNYQSQGRSSLNTPEDFYQTYSDLKEEHNDEVELALDFLKNHDYLVSEIDLIMKLIYSHSGKYKTEAEKIIYVSDKANRLGKNGLIRLAQGRHFEFGNYTKQQQIKRSIKKRMEETYLELVELDYGIKYITKLYAEGHIFVDNLESEMINSKKYIGISNKKIKQSLAEILQD